MKITKTLSEKMTANGESEILFRFVGGRGMIYRAKSGIFVSQNDWTEKTATKPAGIKTSKPTESKEVKKRRQELTEKLKDLETAIENEFNDTPAEKIDKKWLDEVIHNFHFPPVAEEDEVKPLSFFEVLDLFIEKRGEATETPVVKTTKKKSKDFSIKTIRKFKTLRRQLREFDETLTFEDLNFKKLQEFADFELNDKDLVNSSVEKRFTYLRWFLNWATEWGYNKNLAYSNFALNLEVPDKDVIYLDEEELEAVRSHDFSNNPRLDRVRDVFVFCCYTGLRYSDVENLKRSNIRNNKIYITTIKTSDRLEIDLNNVASAILDKYKDAELENNKALPVISNQKMNVALEEMAVQCGIDTPIEQTIFKGGERVTEIVPKYKLVRTHTARRTFVCKAIRLGISPTIIMKFTGHKDYDTMKKYIGAMDKEKAAAMKLFND